MAPPVQHSLLVRQLRSLFGDADPPEEMQHFIDVVDAAYLQFDDDRLMLERSLDLSSDELFHANAELRALFQALPDLVLRVEPNGTIIDVKPGFDRDVYLRADQLLGRRLQDPPISTREGITEEVLGAVLESSQLRTIQFNLALAGTERSYEARLLPFHGSEVLIVVRDITDRVHALRALTEAKEMLEERVAERTAELRDAYEALRAEMHEREQAEARRRRLEAKLLQAQKLESLGVLAGGIAHDFNNLLMAILGNASLGLHALEPDAPVRRHLGEIQAATQRAAGLTNQLLAYSGKGRFVVEPLDVAYVARSMAELLAVSVSKKANLVFELADDLPAVEGDATQLGQIVMNLITNASESLGEGGGTITLRTHLLTADAEYLAECLLGEEAEPGVFVAVEVSDDGAGMDEETVRRIFDPFFTTKFTGRGLGLAAVLGIVRGHHGAMRVASAPGRGTRFTVLLPATGEVAEQRPVRVVGEIEFSGTVLVVDDDPAIRRVIRAALEAGKFRVLVAEDGRDAVSVFRRHVDEISCVVLDLTMPVMDGRQAYDHIREISPEVPVLVISGYARESISSDFSGFAQVDFIQKPFMPSDLLERIDEIVSDPGREVAGAG